MGSVAGSGIFEFRGREDLRPHDEVMILPVRAALSNHSKPRRLRMASTSRGFRTGMDPNG